MREARHGGCRLEKQEKEGSKEMKLKLNTWTKVIHDLHKKKIKVQKGCCHCGSRDVEAIITLIRAFGDYYELSVAIYISKSAWVYISYIDSMSLSATKGQATKIAKRELKALLGDL